MGVLYSIRIEGSPRFSAVIDAVMCLGQDRMTEPNLHQAGSFSSSGRVTWMKFQYK